MNYENLTCPVCGKPLQDGEDVVVCPVCATPQHRDCWIQNGRCANDDLHASGFVWKRENNANTAQYSENENHEGRICHICGSENPEDALHCGNCGALFGEADENAKKNCPHCGKENDSDAIHCKYCGTPLIFRAPQYKGVYNGYFEGTGISPDEMIGGNKAEDLAVFVQASAKRYLPKFKKFENSKKLSFNFAAFFFAPYWFFYRKLYKAGAFFLVMFVTVSMLLSGYSNQLYEASLEYTEAINSFDVENATEEQLAAYEEQMLVHINNFVEKTKKPLLITSAATLVLRLICALAANKLYYKKIVDDLKIINETVREENLKKMMIAKRGGLSAFAFALSLLGENLLVNILVYAADLLQNSSIFGG